MLDPFCGTAGFLAQTLTTWQSAGANAAMFARVYGVDISSQIAQIAKLNLVISGGNAENILVADTLSRSTLETHGIRGSNFDVIISNPPIGMVISNLERFADYQLAYTQKDSQLRQRMRIEELYIEQFLYLLKPGGRAGFIVPESILSTTRNRSLREWLFNNATVEAVISLPAGIWPSTTIKTSVLVISKQQQTTGKPVFMGVVNSVGVDRLGRAAAQNDLPLIARYYDDFRSTQVAPSDDTAWVVPSTRALIDRLDVIALLPSSQRTIEQLKQLVQLC